MIAGLLVLLFRIGVLVVCAVHTGPGCPRSFPWVIGGNVSAFWFNLGSFGIGGGDQLRVLRGGWCDL